MDVQIFNRAGRRLASSGGGTEVRIAEALLAAAEGGLTIRFAIPILDLGGYWKPDLFRPRMQLDWNIHLESAGNRNFPYVALFNADHRNRFSFYLTTFADDTVIRLAMNQQECCYEVSIEIAVTGATAPFELVIDERDCPWTELPANCRARLGIAAPAVPAGAWEPVYCTWYARHAAFDTAFLDEAAREAAELGFGTFIVDDGWSYAAARRVTPETAPTWYRELGRWTVSAEKLDGFAEHVVRARRLGLNYLLWTAPFFIGEKFLRTDSAPGVGGEPGSYRVFDPACRPEWERVLAELRELMRRYSLDGLKVDFLAHVPADLRHPHGRIAWEAIRELSALIRRENPEALIEFRQFYATPATLALATQFRANDTPFDCLENLHRIAQLRLLLGDGVAVHADPVCWHPLESGENIDRHLAAAVAGVPMVSMDLSRLSAENRARLKRWFAFYRRYRQWFQAGRWSMRYEGGQLASLRVEYRGRRMVWLAGAAGLPDAAEADCVLNPSAETWELPGGRLPPGGCLEAVREGRR